MLSPMPRQKALNTRQLKFIKLLVQGESMAQAHRRAGYSCPTIEGHGANAIRLLKSERIQKELQKLKDKQFSKDVLSFNEKRSFLARAVRADANNPDADLVQEVVETHGESGSSKRVKIVSKLEAINIDNKMVGDNYADRSPAVSNPFLFLVTLGKQDAIQEFKVCAPVIDAELVE
jgi:phage terminase small subunit